MGRLLFWSSATLVVLVVALVVSTPWLVRTFLPEAFARFGLEASASGGRFNPLRAEIAILGFTLGDAAEPALALDELGIGIGLRALAGGRIELKRLRVKGVDANTERLMKLWKQVGSDSQSGGGGLPIGLDDVELVDVRLVSVGERIGHDVHIARLGIGNPAGLFAKGKSQVALSGAVGAGSVDISLDMSFDGGTLEGTGTYRLDDVPLPGWARLGNGGGDPLVAGSVSGRGDVHLSFESAHDALGLILDGPLRVKGLAVSVAPVDAERGDASWKGRLALAWTPEMSAPSLRGDGTLEVETLDIAAARDQHESIHAELTDVSWHGNFDWKDAVVMQAGVLGTHAEIRDASNAKPAWAARAENFSWRMRVESSHGADSPGMTMQDIDVSRLDASVGAGDAALGIDVVKIAIDELRTTRSGGLVLGVAGASSVSVTAPRGADGGDPLEIEVHGLVARGMSGDADGALHVASVKAESAEYSDRHANRKLRVDGVELASVGLGVTGLMGADQIHVTSARVQQPSVDVWVSDIEVDRVHADGDGRFGGSRVTLARAFQSPADGLSWQLSKLAVDGIDGSLEDTTRVARIELPSFSLGQGDTSWELNGAHVAGLAVTSSGGVDAARLGLQALERRQAGTGELRVVKLEGKGLAIDDMHAVLEGLTSASVEFRSAHGVEITTEGLTAGGLSGDRTSGVAIERLVVARGAGHAFDDTRIEGSGLESRGLAVGGDGEVKFESATITRLSGALPDSVSLEVDGVQTHAFARTPLGALSTRSASIQDVRIVPRDSAAWTLTRLAASDLGWKPGSGVGIDAASLETLARTHGETRLLLANSLRVESLEVRSSADIDIARLAAASIEGGTGTASWKVDSVDAEKFVRRRGAGEKLDRLGAAKVEVSDSHNGALLSVENASAKTVRISDTEELTASSVNVDAVRIASRKNDWPSRLTLAGLHVEESSLQPGSAFLAQEIVAREPHLVVAQTADNAWMWPPLPGGGGARTSKSKSDAGMGVHIARFTTRGPGRVVYIDHATEPAFQLTLDPLVVALENLDTRRAGGKARFRAHGIGNDLADLRVGGELTRRVGAFDVALAIDATGVELANFNPYVRHREPIVVSAGFGDLDGKIDVDHHRLSGDVSVLLSGLEVRIKDHVPLLARLDPEDFPLRTALALLKDSEGNIHVDVPLNAQTSHENFDVVDTFREAFAQTIETAGKVARDLPGKTLERTLGLLEETVSLLPGVDAENYSAIDFPAGSDAIVSTSRVYLGQLAERMHAHPALTLSLCGRAVPRDATALSATADASSIAKLFDEAARGVFHVYAADHAGLLSLAQSRAGAVRRHLRDVHGVASQRLPACDAQVETSAEARPRVELHVETPAREGGLLDFL